MYPAQKIDLGSVAHKALCALADHEVETGNPARAIDIYRELLERVDAARPNPEGVLQDAVQLSRIYAAKAAAHRRAGQVDLASALESRRLELWNHWARRLPGNPFVLRQLAASTTGTETGSR